ncbi:hypothetical protein [Methylomicrobium lacus]|uniref:hypothetical protein n=1 Tax=Methylomicrobium lacus TaxID=136992 RepID=UPI00045E764D|nr:hypothetical protein [Methylomicrobium lacus]
MKYVITAIAIFTILLSQIAQADESVKEFFDKYVQLSDSFELSVAALYADNAKVHTYRKYPHGLERAMELSGVQWKQLLIQAMPLAKAQNDKSVFSDVTISNYGNGYKIKANRYSNRKCYTDTGYYMVVAPNEIGRLQIIEEYSETQPQSNC